MGINRIGLGEGRELLDAIDVVALLRKMTAAPGAQAAMAERIGVSLQFINAVIGGHKRPTDKILAEVGLRRVERFQPVEGK